EDGIRDLTVTGVQTCALPISHPRKPRRLLLQGGRGLRHQREDDGRGLRRPAGAAARDDQHLRLTPSTAVGCLTQVSACTKLHLRSEERRVGKECRSGWSREDE